MLRVALWLSAATASTSVYQLDEPGFSRVCQEAMGMTAMSKMDSKALAQLKRLLVNKDAVDVAHWGNKVASKYPKTAAYHYQNFHYDKEKINEIGALKCAKDVELDKFNVCEGSACLMDALVHFYVRLAYPDKANDYPFKYPKHMEFTDADALKWVINLMTELHNPDAYFMGGETKRSLNHGRVNVKSGVSLATNASDLARGQICDIMSVNQEAQWHSGWTHIRSLPNQNFYAEEKREFGTTPEENINAFRKWARQTMNKRCELMEKWQHGFELTTRDVEVAHRTVYRNLILEGGARMSIVIHKILEAKKGTNMRVGSGVDVPMDYSFGKKPAASVQQSRHGDTSKIQVFFVNIAIIGVVLAVGWFVLIRDPYQAEKKAYGVGANDREKEKADAGTGIGISMSQMLGKEKRAD